MADYLVREKKLPFRDAYYITGEAVNLAESLGKDISQLSLKELQSIDSRIDEEVLSLLDNRASMDARDSYGGTATKRVAEQIALMQTWLEEQKGGHAG